MKRLGDDRGVGAFALNLAGVGLRGEKHERNVMATQLPRDGQRGVAADPKIQHCAADAVRLDQMPRLFHRTTGTQDLSAGASQDHVEFHRDQEVVLDDQDPRSVQGDFCINATQTVSFSTDSGSGSSIAQTSPDTLNSRLTVARGMLLSMSALPRPELVGC